MQSKHDQSKNAKNKYVTVIATALWHPDKFDICLWDAAEISD